MTYSLLSEFLTSTGLQSLIGAIQVVAVIFVLRGMAKLELQSVSLKRLVEGQVELLGPEDSAHPGARLFWGVGHGEALRGLDEKISTLSERQRVIADRQRDFVESVRELRAGQTLLIQLTQKAINQREHLVG